MLDWSRRNTCDRRFKLVTFLEMECIASELCEWTTEQAEMLDKDVRWTPISTTLHVKNLEDYNLTIMKNKKLKPGKWNGQVQDPSNKCPFSV